MLFEEFDNNLRENVKDLVVIPLQAREALYDGFNAVYTGTEIDKQDIYNAAIAAVKRLVTAKKDAAFKLLKTFEDTDPYKTGYLFDIVFEMTRSLTGVYVDYEQHVDDYGILYCLDDCDCDRFGYPKAFNVRVSYLGKAYGTYKIYKG